MKKRIGKIRLFDILMLLLALTAIVLTAVLAPRQVQRAFRVAAELSASLVADDPIFEDVTILFKGEAIRNLNKYVFLASNSGRQPIVEEEVKQSPTIEFVGDGGILLAQTAGKYPENLQEKLVISEDSHEVSLEFALMNPGDYVRFCVYYSGVLKQDPIISGRISGVAKVESQSLVQPTPPSISPSVRWWEIFLWSLAGLSALMVLAMSRDLKNKREVLEQIDGEASPLLDLVTLGDFKDRKSVV